MFENERLRERINQLFERIETQLRQILRERKIREDNHDVSLKCGQLCLSLGGF